MSRSNRILKIIEDRIEDAKESLRNVPLGHPSESAKIASLDALLALRRDLHREKLTVDKGLRYNEIVNWARKRYTDEDGCLELAVNNEPTPYTRIERAAWTKYMI